MDGDGREVMCLEDDQNNYVASAVLFCCGIIILQALAHGSG